jgi:MFS family permease
MKKEIFFLLLLNALQATGFSLGTPLFPLIAQKLNVSETTIGLIFSSFSIANILIIPCLPALLHYSDKKFLFWFSLLIEVKIKN